MEGQQKYDWLIFQPTGAGESIDAIEQGIAESYNGSFKLISFPVDNWNDALSPWAAPSIFGGNAFGGMAEDTLKHVLAKITSINTDKFKNICIGGYSMAGLFALYATMKCSIFDAVCAVSPSVWFPDWIPFAKQHPVNVSQAYISLGDREHRSRHELVQHVHEYVQQQYELFHCTKHLDWNNGTHFTNPIGRMVRGYLWVIGNNMQSHTPSQQAI